MTQQNNTLHQTMSIELLGNTNQTGSFMIDSNTSIIEIGQHYGNGMKDEKQLELVQIGGPLGCFVKGKSLTQTLSFYQEDLEMNSLLFLNNAFCPVDFARFIIFFVKREMQHQSKELDRLCILVDEIVSGTTQKYTYNEFLDIANDKDDVMVKLKSNVRYLITHYGKDFEEHVDQKKCAHSICYKLFSAQCINTCPAEINIPGYVALMYRGKDEEAYRLMRQNNPLSFVCGKICARPCESRCRRGEIEQTVGVRALKHYAASVTLDKPFREEKKEDNGKSVGIIGSGPAGLSAAYYLVKAGYEVHVYEKFPVVGGMLAVGIPSYRLSQESIDKEVKLIENLGVKFHTNTEIGKHIYFRDLHTKHDCVLLATGCHKANLFSDHLDNVESAIDFLREVKLAHRSKVGREVIVIGGGDVAMDAARTAMRLGAENVRVVSLESYAQMPANAEEKEEALAEGIELICGYGTDTIRDEQNNAYAIDLKKCTALFDLENNFNPIYDEKNRLQFDCDQVILAIGQRSDVAYLNGAVQLDERGRIVQSKKYETSNQGIFFAGDLSAPGSAIKAIAEGRAVTERIDQFLKGEGLFEEEQIEIPKYQLHYSVWDEKQNIEAVKLYTKGNKNPFGENRWLFRSMVATHFGRKGATFVNA